MTVLKKSVSNPLLTEHGTEQCANVRTGAGALYCTDTVRIRYSIGTGTRIHATSTSQTPSHTIAVSRRPWRGRWKVLTAMLSQLRPSLQHVRLEASNPAFTNHANTNPHHKKGNTRIFEGQHSDGLDAEMKTNEREGEALKVLHKVVEDPKALWICALLHIQERTNLRCRKRDVLVA